MSKKIIGKEILRKLIEGEYFRKGDYFKEDQLKTFNEFVKDFRKIVKEDRDYFKETIKNLILSDDKRKVLLGINFGRYYLNDQEIYDKLTKFTGMPTDYSLQMKIQAIYELLETDDTPINKKQEWFNFLIMKLNSSEYEELFRQVYGIRSKKDQEKYFGHLFKKLSDAPNNKKWVYLIELLALKKDKKEASEKIREYVKSDDKFVSMVAKKCLNLCQ